MSFLEQVIESIKNKVPTDSDKGCDTEHQSKQETPSTFSAYLSKQ
jgi:hypothetical protein